TRFTRLRSASSTSIAKPRYSTFSPARGTRPNTEVTSPPTVPTVSSSVSGASRACSSRSTFTRPATTTAPSFSTVIGSASWSYSSLISPTISSTMSSTVTRPAVPPYSSITTANVLRPAWNSFSRSAIFFVSGTTNAARTNGPTGSEPSPSYSTRSRTLATPTMSSRLSPKTGTRLYFVSRKILRSSSTGAAAATATMSGRGVITSRTIVSAKRATASTSLPSSGSWTGAGGTSRKGGGFVSSSSARADSPAARLRSAATRGASAWAYGWNTGRSTSSERSGFRRTNA